jgi:hypothetical protein
LKCSSLNLYGCFARGTLDHSSRAFTRSDDRIKGFFPYDLLVANNFLKKLKNSESCTQESFYFNFNGSGISDTDSAMY